MYTQQKYNLFQGLGLVCSLLLAQTINAEVKPNTLFSKNAVIQQKVAVPVWGAASVGEKITVSFQNQVKTTTADNNGRWYLKLDPLKVGGPFSMTIAGTNKIIADSIYVGEVWFCSGQSNMEWPLSRVMNANEEIAKANFPLVREFIVPKNIITDPTTLTGAKTTWLVCSPATVGKFSAVSYFFGTELFKKINIPVGLINSSWGGTPAEKWISKEALEQNPELKSIVDDYNKATLDYTSKIEAYLKNETQLMEKWKIDSDSARLLNKPLPKKPMKPRSPFENGDCGGLFVGMVMPILPYPIKGTIWYQGESNAYKSKQYQTLFPAMIQDWRSKWNLGDFPFLFVQIAPFKGQPPLIREAQLISYQKVKNTAMAVTVDVGDSVDIHPINKRPVGERLALAARSLAYGEKIEFMGPIYKSSEIKGNKITLTFDHLGKGLVAKDGDLIGFELAGNDKKFVPAIAKIVNNKVIVESATITEPKFVRFGWRNVPRVNLYNAEGLPASPFRTDTD
jgi:sialate O-acetylesterase